MAILQLYQHNFFLFPFLSFHLFKLSFYFPIALYVSMGSPALFTHVYIHIPNVYLIHKYTYLSEGYDSLDSLDSLSLFLHHHTRLSSSSSDTAGGGPRTIRPPQAVLSGPVLFFPASIVWEMMCTTCSDVTQPRFP